MQPQHKHALITGSPANSRSNSHVKSGDLPKDRHHVVATGDSGGHVSDQRGGDGSRVKRRCRNRSASTSVKIQGSPPHSEAMLDHEEDTLIVSEPKAESQCAEKDSEAKLDQTEETLTIDSEANDAEEETWSEWEARILREEDSERKINQEELMDCQDQEEETWSDWEARILSEEENNREELVVSILRSNLVDKFALGETVSCELASNHEDNTESLTIPDTAPEPLSQPHRSSSPAGLDSSRSPLKSSCPPACTPTEEEEENLVVSISRSYLVDKFSLGETVSCEVASDHGDIAESPLPLTIPVTVPEPLPHSQFGARSSSPAGLPVSSPSTTADRDSGKSGSYTALDQTSLERSRCPFLN